MKLGDVDTFHLNHMKILTKFKNASKEEDGLSNREKMLFCCPYHPVQNGYKNEP